MKWQTIESAPKDGSIIGLWSPKYKGVIKVALWGHHLAKATQPLCWVTATPTQCAISHLPTHWIPLPPPPGAQDA